MMEEVGPEEHEGKVANIASQLQDAALTNVTQGRIGEGSYLITAPYPFHV